MIRNILVEIDDAPRSADAGAGADPLTVPRPPGRPQGDVLAGLGLHGRYPPWNALPGPRPPSPPPRPNPLLALTDIEGRLMFAADPFSASPFTAVADNLTLDIGPAMIRASTLGYVDADANEYRHGLLAPTFERSLVNGSTIGGRASVSLGDLEFDNTDGFFDTVPEQCSVDGRSVVLRMQEADGSFSVVFDGTARDWVPGRSRTRLRLRDFDYLLNKPAQAALYANTAPADIANRPLPICYGPCRNVTPTRIPPLDGLGRPTFQVHDGAVQGIGAIYVGGVPLQPADVASRNTATGIFVLATEPAATVTCDVDGAVVGGVYLNTTALVIEDLVFRRAGLDAARKSAAHLAQLAADLPGEIRLHIPHTERPTVYDLVDRLLSPFGWSGFSWLGRFQCGVWKLPGGTPKALISLDEGALSIEPLPLPAGVYPPPWRVRGGYDRNGTVQSASDLRGDASSPSDPVGGTERRRWLARAQDIALAHNLAVRDTLHLGAQDPEPWETFFVGKVAAELVLQSYLSLWTGNRALFRVTGDWRPFWFDLDDVVLLLDRRHGLWNGGNGRLARVAGVRETGRRTELTVMV